MMQWRYFDALRILHETSQAPAQLASRTSISWETFIASSISDSAAGISDCIIEQSINFRDESHNKPMINTAIAAGSHLVDPLFGRPTFQNTKVSYESVPTVVNKLANLIFICELSLLALVL